MESWARMKKEKDIQDLKDVEASITALIDSDSSKVLYDNEIHSLKSLEAKKKNYWI